MTCILYIKEQASVGVVIIPMPLCKVKGATMLKFACGTQIEDYDFTSRGLGRIVSGRQEGDPEIKLQVAGREDYPLANWPGAVAVTVTDRVFLRDDDGRRDDGAHESWLTSCHLQNSFGSGEGCGDIGQKSCGGRRDGLFGFGDSRIGRRRFAPIGALPVIRDELRSDHR